MPSESSPLTTPLQMMSDLLRRHGYRDRIVPGSCRVRLGSLDYRMKVIEMASWPAQPSSTNSTTP